MPPNTNNDRQKLQVSRFLFVYGFGGRRKTKESDMPGRNAIRISKRSVDALAVERGEAVFWDRDLTGFGVRVYATGRKVYVVQMRGPTGSPKRATVGVHGKVAPDEARKDAAAAIDRIRRGEDPFPLPPVREPTIADLAKRYMAAHVEVNCRPKTVETFRRAVDHYIVPELGHLALSAVERSHVSDLHFKMRDKPCQANQTVGVLAKMFRLAEAWGMTPPRRNPCRSVRHYKKNRRERFLTPEEYRRLGRVLDECRDEGRVLTLGGRGDPAAAADRLPQERDRHPAVGRRRPHGGRDQAPGHQDRCAAHPADAGGGTGAGRHSADREQTLGDCRAEAGGPSEKPRPDLGAYSPARRFGRCANS